MLLSISEGVSRLARAGRMTCKVRHDFKIITDVISCVPKSLYKKMSNEILAELKAVVKTGALKVPEALTCHTPVCYDLSAVSNSQLSHTHHHHREEGRRRNFSSCSDHCWIKTTAIFFFLTFEFEYFFFCRLLSLQHKTLVLWYNSKSTWLS